MAIPPRKASSSNKRKEMATKPNSPQSKKRVSVGAQTSMKGKTVTKSPVKHSWAGARNTQNISTTQTQSTQVNLVPEMNFQAMPNTTTSEPSPVSLADASHERIQVVQEKGLVTPTQTWFQ